MLLRQAITRDVLCMCYRGNLSYLYLVWSHLVLLVLCTPPSCILCLVCSFCILCRVLYLQAIAAGTIPVIISDDIDLPFADLVDYSTFTLQVDEQLAARQSRCVLAALRDVVMSTPDEVLALFEGVAEQRLTFQYSNAPGAAVDMLLRSLARRKRFLYY